LRLHPSVFRERFGPEMLSIFDLSTARTMLIADACVSLARQWTFRGDFRAPESSGAVSCGGMFQFQDQRYSRLRNPVVLGLVPAFCCFVLTSFLITHGGHSGVYVIGSDRSSQTGIPLTTRSTRADLNTEVVASRPDILDTFGGRDLVRGFYRMIRALSALDANHDLVLSREEIENAPQRLRELDRNHDGVLSVSECGSPLRRLPSQQLPGEQDVMRSNPVLASLDADGDGSISTKEIENAPSRLKLLDRDHNAKLTPDEVLSQGQRKIMEEFEQ